SRTPSCGVRRRRPFRRNCRDRAGARPVRGRSASPLRVALGSDPCLRLVWQGPSYGADRPRAHRPPWRRRTRHVSLILRASASGVKESGTSVARPSIGAGVVGGRTFTRSLEDLEGSFEELVLRSLV